MFMVTYSCTNFVYYGRQAASACLSPFLHPAYSDLYYLKVTIICRYIFLRIGFKASFASTNICDLYAEMVQGRHFLMFGSTYS